MIDPLNVDIPLAEPTAPNAVPHERTYLLKPSPDHPDDYICEVDYSGWSTFISCARMGENYLLRRREFNGDNSAQDFGHLFHSLEEHRLRGTSEKIPVTIAEHFLTHHIPPTDHRTADMMTKVFSSYQIENMKDGWRDMVLYVNGEPMIERPFKVPLCTVAIGEHVSYPRTLLTGIENEGSQLYIRNLHFVYIGRIDTVLQQGEFLWVVDSKTTSRGGKEYEEAFRLSLQTRGYCWAAQKILSRPVMGLILNGAIVRTPTKTGKGTEFLRRNFFYSQDSLEEWEDTMKAYCSSFATALRTASFPQAARSFISPCAKCAYQENCALPRSQRAADLASDIYRDVTWSPIY